jgi:hypothetical protein
MARYERWSLAQGAPLVCVDRLMGQNHERADGAGGEIPQQAGLFMSKTPSRA